ncbi:hypothetical protein ACJX0J_017390, partial [Zea mays]
MSLELAILVSLWHNLRGKQALQLRVNRKYFRGHFPDYTIYISGNKHIVIHLLVYRNVGLRLSRINFIIGKRGKSISLLWLNFALRSIHDINSFEIMDYVGNFGGISSSIRMRPAGYLYFETEEVYILVAQGSKRIEAVIGFSIFLWVLHKIYGLELGGEKQQTISPYPFTWMYQY